jgi:hypothetical protein
MAGSATQTRDLRLDFFRGLAMFIILIAHTPDNKWTLWIPARFGFSDATEMFVFCSGMASAVAFGAVFARRGWFIGTARILFRIWQVYWAQIGMVIAAVVALLLIDLSGTGVAGRSYLGHMQLDPLLTRTDEALLGLVTLTWVPNYFDILPMYLVILALVPVMMAIRQVAGTGAAVAASLMLWLAAQLHLLNLPGRPWDDAVIWYFNPFGWQLVFFTGFALMAGWIPAPPVDRRLVHLAAAYVIVSLPVAWHRLYAGVWIPEGSLVQQLLGGLHDALFVLIWKTEAGGLRFLHFLALAYLAWVAVGPGGVRLSTGWTAPGAPPRWLVRLALVAAVVTVPFAWAKDIAFLSPALDAAVRHAMGPVAEAWLGVSLLLPDDRVAFIELGHLAALAILVWAAIGPARRSWVCRDGFLRLVPLIRKVGSQSLAVFVFSMVLAQVNGWLLDLVGRHMWSFWVVNLWGFAALLAVAHVVGWFKSEPWRTGAREAALRPAGSRRTEALPAE